MDGDRPVPFCGGIDRPVARARQEGYRQPRQRQEEPDGDWIDDDPIPLRGLSKFNLGTVPASVTPPRTWRRAAWFVIVSTAASFCVLLISAALLGESSRTQRPAPWVGHEQGAVEQSTTGAEESELSDIPNIPGVGSVREPARFPAGELRPTPEPTTTR